MTKKTENSATSPAAKARHTAQATARRRHYHVYVVELSPEVLRHARFVRANPGYIDGKPCVYVGMTGLDPDVRFDKHMAGIQANRYVTQFGQRLLPELYELYNPLTYDEARSLEVELGIDLRESGYGVWQA
jgi:methylase of polypeptide subunit release factors